jgi:glycosyltransferase involved in cell wall biosynthesis
MTRIGIDVHSIGSGKGGNETYYRELITSLGQSETEHEFILYHNSLSGCQQLPSGERFKPVLLHSHHPLLRTALTLPWRASRDRLDIFHAMYVLPPFVRCKTVTTIADIAFEHYPELFPAHEVAWFKSLVRGSAQRSDHVITVSEYSKQDLVRTYGIAESKITVTHEGASDRFCPRDRDSAKEWLARRYQISGDFILYLGRLQGRKNLLRLVKAYAKIRDEGLPYNLVLAGKQDSKFAPVLECIRALGIEQCVLLPGYIPDEDVPAFYNAAEVFAYPSLFEGFGLPVLEAMACGTPVITSRGSSLQEVAGNAAILIDPLDELSIAAALKTVLLDQKMREGLRVAGIARSRQFSFRQTARQTVLVYERLTA